MTQKKRKRDQLLCRSALLKKENHWSRNIPNGYRIADKESKTPYRV